MLVRRWAPLADLRMTHRAVDRAWREFDCDLYPIHNGSERWSIPLDVVREGDNIAVRASVPGVKPEEIDVTIDEGVLTIKGEAKIEEEGNEASYLLRERRVGSFFRALRLPETVDADKANSQYHDGVLTITFPKLESKKTKHLKVQVNGKAKAVEGEKK